MAGGTLPGPDSYSVVNSHFSATNGKRILRREPNVRDRDAGRTVKDQTSYYVKEGAAAG